MKLARKLTLALVLGILLVLGGNAAVRVRRELSLFETDSRRDSLLLGRMLAGSVARVWPTAGEEQALDLVEDANERESTVRIRFIWLDLAAGEGEGPDLEVPVEARDAPFARIASEGENEGALYTYVPVTVPGGRLGAVEIRDSMLNQQLYVGRTLVQALTATAALVVLCGGVAMGLGLLLVGRPVAELIGQARTIGRGDFSHRLELRQRDEIGELAKEMNSMCELLERAHRTAEEEASARITTLEQLRHADRLSTVGRLAAGVAHELGTPLNVVLGRAQLIVADHPGDGQTAKNASIIIDQAKRMTAIIRQLLDFARRGEARTISGNLLALALQTKSLLEPIAAKARVEIAVTGDPSLRAELDSAQIQQALANLAVNGIQAMAHDGGGVLEIEVCRKDARPPPDADALEGASPEGAQPCVAIVVRDQGHGIPGETLERIFEPFFTTKPAGEGTGLGLSVSYGIVRDHGGFIDVESEPGRGSAFAICFPERSV